ncbi:MAG: ORF6N domain-containing protein [Kiritimatiellae bacterium]|nr:ORF6N domain-containing protein [Kiritimatiellia bacterium]
MNAVPAKLDTDAVKTRMIEVRGQTVLLDRDVASLYGVETREINQAVKNNHAKFPDGYVFQLSDEEFSEWRSKFLISGSSDEEKAGVKRGLRHAPNAFTERGLYMLATILKGARAVETTLSIIETYAQVRELARTMESLQNVKDGGNQQRSLLQRTGELLANVVSENLKTETSETEIELNFAIVKIRHKIVKKVK